MNSDILRDVSWHPYKPYIYATHFDGKVYVTKFVSCKDDEVEDEKEEEEEKKSSGMTPS